jgi:hypothetical protein
MDHIHEWPKWVEVRCERCGEYVPSLHEHRCDPERRKNHEKSERIRKAIVEDLFMNTTSDGTHPLTGGLPFGDGPEVDAEVESLTTQLAAAVAALKPFADYALSLGLAQVPKTAAVRYDPSKLLSGKEPSVGDVLTAADVLADLPAAAREQTRLVPEAEWQELLKDRERLDTLEKRLDDGCTDLLVFRGQPTWGWGIRMLHRGIPSTAPESRTDGRGKSLRAAIDDARAKGN